MFSKQIFGIFLTLLFVGFLIFGCQAVFGQESNQAPLLQTVSRQYVLEGEKLSLCIKAVDGDNDKITIGIISRPIGAVFVDSGNGSALFEWTPDFTGPNSADGSPYELCFWAGDGENSSSISAEVIVINNNRSPYIISPDTVVVQSGSELSFDVYGYDPDFDVTDWKLIEKPAELNFVNGNPGTAGWPTAYADSGYHNALIELSDQYGASDTAEVVMDVLQTEVYALSIDTNSAYSGELVDIGVNLMNLDSVSGINLLVNYDASVLSFFSISTVGTRIEDWEYFSYGLNDRGISGDIRLSGTADLDNGPVADDLGTGEGSLVNLTFQVSYNLGYAGYSIPVRFVFRDILIGDDNTMTAPDGSQIIQDMLGYTDGYVTIKSIAEENIGDINMNGIAFEIGDAIYFSNHFIDNINYPFSPLQMLISDVNRDGYGGTIADLVYLIHALLNFSQQNGKLRVEDEKVVLLSNKDGENYKFSSKSNIDLGGFAITLEAPGVINSEIKISSQMQQHGMTLKSSVDGNTVRLIVYSEEGRIIPSGLNEIFEIDNNIEFNIKDVQLSTTDGFVVESILKDDFEALLPKQFKLYQNHPNPFNPTTEIRFELPRSSAVALTVYNILGQEIITLADRVMPAGVHSIVWDGRDYNGTAVASGIYFYRLGSDGFSDKKKMILLK